jgi:hypothetical protein
MTSSDDGTAGGPADTGAWRGKMQQQIIWRTGEQVARFFASTALVDPGLVRVEDWRPDPGAADGRKFAGWAAVGRKR